MEPILKSIREAGKRYQELNSATRMLVAGVLSLATVIAVVAMIFEIGRVARSAMT